MTRSLREAPFGTVVTAMATPFDAAGRLDLAGTAELARHLVDNASDSLVVTGTTGEVPTLTDDERVELWRTVREAVTVPLIAGSTSNDTAHSVEMTRRATAAGMDGILAVTPYYNRPSQAGIEAHFRAIAAATDLPVYCYDIPLRTGRKISSELLLRLAREVPNVEGVKDATGDPAVTARLLAEAPVEFSCYSGDDGLTLPLLSIGAIGVISVASHWCGPEIKEMITRFSSGDVEGARVLNDALSESFAAISFDDAPNPVPVKAVLRALGLPAGQCRLPLGPAPEGLAPRVEAMLDRLDKARATLGLRG